MKRLRWRWIPTSEQRALTQIGRQMTRWGVRQWYWSMGPDRWTSVIWSFHDTVYGFSSVAITDAPAGTALRQCARLIRQCEADATRSGIAWTVLAPQWIDATPRALTHSALPKCFQVLGFDAIPTTRGAIAQQYHRLAKTLHPDAGGDAAAFHALTEAAQTANAWMIAYTSRAHTPSRFPR